MNIKTQKYTEEITPRGKNFSQWYQDIISSADLAEHSPTKGSMIIKPLGFAIWENIKSLLDKMIKETGVENAYFPLLIPERLLKKERTHVEGFSPEVAVVTYGGGKRLKEALVIRPTSETIIYEAFSRWINSHQDLPILINQWANVVRWEMRPRLFLRTTEFLWQEGHTAHTTEKEADERARLMLEIYKKLIESYLAIPVIAGVKTENEKFAGAKVTYTLEAMMQDGKALQMATSHNLGQNFAKAFDLQFSSTTGSPEYCWQTSWGLSTRTIGGLILVHSDNTGLVLPPKIAPVQIVIVPIWGSKDPKGKVIRKSISIYKKLAQKYKDKIKIDTREMTPGNKFYYWEKRGVPIRLEFGPKELNKNCVVLARRDTGEKLETNIEETERKIEFLLREIQNNLYNRALQYQKNKTRHVETLTEFDKEINLGNFVVAYWGGEKKVEKRINKETGATIRCLPFNLSTDKEGQCVYSGKKTYTKALFAKAY